MSNIFISHSHADKPFVRKFASDLMASGHKVWIDEAELNIGDSLIKKIVSGLFEVDYVAAILSSHSIENLWVQQELKIAYTREINEKRVVVLPILIEAVELPDYLADKFYANFVNKRLYKKNLALLLRTFEMPRYKTPQVPLSIFLCHSSIDKPKVRELYQRLRKDKFHPWLDEESLLPGQDWQQEIPKAVRNSNIVVVCLSKGSINKAGYIQKEIKYALDVADEQPDGVIFIIPLKLEECDVPERLRKWQWVNYFNDDGYQRLMMSLSIRAATYTSHD